MAHELGRRLKSASQQLRAARLDGSYADICLWLNECDACLDAWLENRKNPQPKGDNK